MKIHKTRVTLENGDSVDIIHNFENVDGAVDSLFSEAENWEAITSDFSPESFVAYIKEKQPDRYIMTQKQFNDFMPKVIRST